MRTTINIDDELLLEAKRIAANSGRSVQEVVNRAIRDSSVAAMPPGSASESFCRPTAVVSSSQV